MSLMFKATPIGVIVAQAGGRASTGRGPVMQLQPQGLHQRIGLVFGSKHEVERIERYHDEPFPLKKADFETPLFAERSLFRD
jgi:fructose-1,6-bisphosphatase I/sedoheptulose-1,7-bisphosphatase